MRPIVRAGKLSYHTMGLAESRGEPKGHRNDNYRRFAKQHSARITRRALKAELAREAGPGEACGELVLR